MAPTTATMEPVWMVAAEAPLEKCVEELMAKVEERPVSEDLRSL